MKPKYSGKQSVKFWRKINSIEPYKRQMELYRLACDLQDLECALLKRLKKAKQ